MQTKEATMKPIQKAAFLFTLFLSPMLMAQSYVVNLFEVRDGEMKFFVDDRIDPETGTGAGVGAGREGLNFSVENKAGILYVKLHDTRSNYAHEQTFDKSDFVDLNDEGLKILVRKSDSDVAAQVQINAGAKRTRPAGGVTGGNNRQAPRGVGGVAGEVIKTFEELENKH